MGRETGSLDHKRGRVDVGMVGESAGRERDVEVGASVRDVGGHADGLRLGLVPVVWVKDLDLVLGDVGDGRIDRLVDVWPEKRRRLVETLQEDWPTQAQTHNRG